MLSIDFSSALRLTLAAGSCLVAATLLAGCKTAPHAPAAAATAPAKADASPKINFPINHDDWAKLGYRLDWIGYPYARATKNDIVSVTPFDDALVLQNKKTEAVLLDALTGERRWGAALDNPLTKFVGVVRDPRDAGQIIISSESQGYVLLVATGNLVAKEKYLKVVNTKPLVVGNTLVFGTPTNEIFAHLLGQNVKVWGFLTDGAIVANLVSMSNGVIAAVSQGGDVVFLNHYGQLLGKNRILGPVGTDPVADGASLYIAGRDQSVWAFAANGALRWRYRTAAPLSQQPAVRDGILYVTVGGEGMTALDTATGNVNWTNKQTSGTVIGGRKGKLLVRTSAGLDILDPVTGYTLASIKLPGIVQIVPQANDDAPIYAVSEACTVGKFIPKD